MDSGFEARQPREPGKKKEERVEGSEEGSACACACALLYVDS